MTTVSDASTRTVVVTASSGEQSTVTVTSPAAEQRVSVTALDGGVTVAKVTPSTGAPATVTEKTVEPTVVTVGLPGPPGLKGDPGPQGPEGPIGTPYYAEFGFAVASNTWTIVHDQNTYGLDVVAVDINGDVIEGDVQYPDANTITVSWYYPTAGTARVYS